MTFLTAIFIGLSLRTPNIEKNPFDYEVSTGTKIETQYYHSDIKVLYERENGKEYNGRIHSHDLKYIYLTEYVKEAKDLHKQSAISKYPFKYEDYLIEPGIGLTTVKYKDKKYGGFLKISNKYLKVEAMGYKKIDYLKASLETNIKISEDGKFYLTPKASYFATEDKEFYSAKVVLGYKI